MKRVNVRSEGPGPGAAVEAGAVAATAADAVRAKSPSQKATLMNTTPGGNLTFPREFALIAPNNEHADPRRDSERTTAFSR